MCSRIFWHVGLHTAAIVKAWGWCNGAEICGSWYVINGVLQSAFVGRYSGCTNMYSINKVKIAECLVSAVSRLVCEQTHRELSTLYITVLWMKCLVFQVASLPQASPPKHCIHLSSQPHTCYMPHPSLFSQFENPNNILWVQKIKLLIMKLNIHTYIYIYIYI